MRIAVIGARGQFGSEVMRAAQHAGIEPLSLDRERCDVTDPASVSAAIGALAPLDLVVNTAAFHRVDDCETQAAKAVEVNARGALYVSEAARRASAAVAYVSTDFVFDGAKSMPYIESDTPAPLSVYGATKFAGEALTVSSNPKNFVIRVAGLFGPAGSRGKGGNFVEWMVAKGRAGESPEVVDDLITSPTSAADAASLLVALAKAGASPGIYHLANSGSCSWYEFAVAIYELCGFKGTAVRRATHIDDQPGRARRPKYSALASERLAGLGLSARPWREGLVDYLRAKGCISNTCSNSSQNESGFT